VFCDQRAISGHNGFEVNTVEAEIEAALRTIPQECKAEIAYFGGSFTVIDRSLMIRLLDVAECFVRAGQASGIRFSTRPDAVGEDVLELLSGYTISAIELGLQSMDDDVLARCRRGHTAKQAEDACRRIVARGYPLVGQMMLGLPGSTSKSERYTAERICALGACAARVYPTVVFDGTALAVMMRSGQYVPLALDHAIERAADVMEIFLDHDVELLRVGLCASEGLCSEAAIGGAYHPAMGELAYNALFYRRMRTLLEKSGQAVEGKTVTFLVPRGKISQAVGQHRVNVERLKQAFGLFGVRVYESDALEGMQVLLKDEK
jgi:histone acetyltransferase (RNA polymerase elongator complex component)